MYTVYCTANNSNTAVKSEEVEGISEDTVIATADQSVSLSPIDSNAPSAVAPDTVEVTEGKYCSYCYPNDLGRYVVICMTPPIIQMYRHQNQSNTTPTLR